MRGARESKVGRFSEGPNARLASSECQYYARLGDKLPGTIMPAKGRTCKDKNRKKVQV